MKFLITEQKSSAGYGTEALAGVPRAGGWAALSPAPSAGVAEPPRQAACHCPAAGRRGGREPREPCDSVDACWEGSQWGQMHGELGHKCIVFLSPQCAEERAWSLWGTARLRGSSLAPCSSQPGRGAPLQSSPLLG